MEWVQALEVVAGFSDLPPSLGGSPSCTGGVCDCSLEDGSAPGEWRLPTIGEWQTMVADAVALGCTGSAAPAITSDNGLGCWNENDNLCLAAGTSCSFVGVVALGYWSSSNDIAYPRSNAWDINLFDGAVFLSPKATLNYVWPVRGGQ